MEKINLSIVEVNNKKHLAFVLPRELSKQLYNSKELNNWFMMITSHRKFRDITFIRKTDLLRMQSISDKLKIKSHRQAEKENMKEVWRIITGYCSHVPRGFNQILYNHREEIIANNAIFIDKYETGKRLTQWIHYNKVRLYRDQDDNLRLIEPIENEIINLLKEFQ